LLLLLRVRWQLFLNSLRKRNRRIELLVQSAGMLFAAIFVLGIGAGFFAGALASIRMSQIWLLGILLWVVFLMWQLAPILFEGYSPGINFREIARYPVSFRLYVVLNCAYGLSDPAAIACLFWMLCLWLAVLFERPAWSLPAAGILLAFAAFNVFCNRLLIGLLERFQSTRKGRERMAVILLVLMVTPQLINMTVINWDRMSGAVAPAKSILYGVAALNRLSPPGAALAAISGDGGERLTATLCLLGYMGVAALLLRRQARAVYLGEIYSDSFRVRHELKVEPGWRVPGLDEITSAIIEKEFRYLRQNARLLVQLVYPLVIFALLFSSRGATRRAFPFAGQGSTAMLGMMAGFLMLSVANMAYNVFGLDREGFGRWLLAPVKLQNIMLAKNLTHAILFITMYTVVAGVMLVFNHVPLLQFAGITVSFITVLVIQLGIGNLFSAWWPKKVDLSQMSSRTVSNAAGYASLLVIAPVGILAGLITLASRYLGWTWLPLVAGLVLLAGAIKLYFYSLNRAANYIHDHIEEIEQTLAK
jgi:ABC-2 type transport system permease protein